MSIKVIDEKTFKAASDNPDTAGRTAEGTPPNQVPMLNETEIQIIERKLETPIELQKNLAAKIKLYVDDAIARDMNEKRYLTETTRHWIETYNELLNNIHKNTFGDKTLNIHLGKVTHAHISGLMRKYKNVTPRTERTGDEPNGNDEDQASSTDG